VTKLDHTLIAIVNIIDWLFRHTNDRLTDSNRLYFVISNLHAILWVRLSSKSTSVRKVYEGPLILMYVSFWNYSINIIRFLDRVNVCRVLNIEKLLISYHIVFLIVGAN
jgi:hypothetical protein